MKPLLKKSINSQNKELADLVSLGRRMRSAQVDFEEVRGYGSLIVAPKKSRTEKLETEFDRLLGNYPET